MTDEQRTKETLAKIESKEQEKGREFYPREDTKELQRQQTEVYLKKDIEKEKRNQ